MEGSLQPADQPCVDLEAGGSLSWENVMLKGLANLLSLLTEIKLRNGGEQEAENFVLKKTKNYLERLML